VEAFNFSDLNEAIAAAIPDREALVWRDRRISYAQLASRSRRLARYLHQRGLGAHTERDELAGHESGQDHVALYLYNGNEYIEGMLGAFKARAASLNVNYRYVEEELLYLFDNSQARAILYHAGFADRVAAIRDRLPQLEVLIQVADESGAPLLPGAVDYEEAIASVPDELPPVTPSPDDLYILYTGGTTGMPKGVLWRSDDIFVAAMGGRAANGDEFESVDAIVEAAVSAPPIRSLCGPPFMHGAAQWMAFNMLRMGAAVVVPSVVDRFDARDYLETIVRERCVTATMVGDAFAAPIIDELDRGDYDLSGLLLLSSGGAPLSAVNKRKLLDRLPHITLMDGLGSSETGVQASQAATRDGEITTGDFRPAPGSCVVSAELDRVLDHGEEAVGWFAQTGRVPLGYLGDAEKTARTFPVIEGVRYSVPGDRASVRADGTFDIFGRDSVTINSGGEKIFAEEVEAALKHHPDVYDVVVAGRESERWGQEVVAIVRLREGATPDTDSLREEASRHIARYKLPKAYVFRDVIERSPSGKADYRWARAQAIG
jgi:fatty-acyl-CoA synthase